MKTARISAMLTVATIGAALTTLAATAPSFVTDEAVFWLDATTLSQLPGQEVTTWPDVRGEGHPVASTSRGVNPKMISTSGALAGKKAVDFGNLGSNKDMAFGSALNNVMMIFFVMDIDNAKYACLIGGGNGNQRFCREKQAAYAANYNQTQSYSIWTNGEKVADPFNTATPSGYNIITYRYDSNTGFPCVGYLASDRNIDGRIGGKRLCEVIGFTRVLTDAERVAVEDYLRKKWFQESWSWADGVSVNDLLGMAQVHFDASVASSFHYDTEDTTKVVQWDDLSSNHNNFTPGTTYGTISGIHYGSVGTVASKPVFDMGAPSSGIDLTLNTRLANTHTTFMVAEVQRNGNVFWLGDDSASGHGKYAFHRGGNGQYAYSVTSSEVMIDPKNGGEVWCNSVKVSSPTGSYPDDPGALSVYTFRTVNNCGWKNLGQDRSTANRNGGKKVAELIAFEYVLPDEARTRIEDYLIEKWTPTEAYIDAMAPVHVDASSADNFNYTSSNITGWKNVGLGADLYYYPQGYLNETPYSMGYGSYGMTNGVPAFLMGVCGSNIDLAFERLTNIRAVFWAMDIHRSGRAFFLGDPRMTAGQDGVYHFHRGGNGEYAYNQSNVIWKNQNVCCDGIQVANMATAKPPYGMHVYDVSSSANLTAAALSGDRWCDHRNGGRAISELLIFTNTVWGLTRVGVRRRIENKWTRRCDWAGAGDAEWGADKYRVFGADATVPEGGASAKGVGFTANATLDGDTLTLGEGGVFASLDTTATIGAALAGNIAAHGPGTVRFASAVTLPSLYVGFGSNVSLPVGSSISGNLTMREGSRLVVDVSALPRKQYAEITLGGPVSLREGGTLADYVALSDDGHTLSFSADGTKILVNGNVPVRAVWKGGANVKDPANWTCYDEKGDETSNMIPGRYVTSVTLNEDLDLRNWGTPVFASGVVIDLHGKHLYVDNLDGTVWQYARFVNTDSDTTATIEVRVNSGTVSDTTATVEGNVKFVKAGAGTFVVRFGQTYTGGTEVAGGTLKAGVAGTNNPLGARNTCLTVDAGAVFDVNAKGGWGGYGLTLAGGKLQNSGGGMNANAGLFTNITLTANSEISMPNNSQWALAGANYSPVTIYLDGKTLKSDIYQVDINLIFCNVKFVGGGYFNVNSGGNFQTGVKGSAAANNEIVATDVDLRMNAAMRLYAPVSVRNYEAVYAAIDWVGCDSTENAELKVHGAFKPSNHDVFYGCTMMDGSLVDLSNRTAAGKLPFHTTCAMTGNSASCAHKSVTFAPRATVTVDLTPFDVKTLVNTYILTWDAPPANSVKFVPDAATANRSYVFTKDGTGLKLIQSGFTIFVR